MGVSHHTRLVSIITLSKCQSLDHVNVSHHTKCQSSYQVTVNHLTKINGCQSSYQVGVNYHKMWTCLHIVNFKLTQLTTLQHIMLPLHRTYQWLQLRSYGDSFYFLVSIKIKQLSINYTQTTTDFKIKSYWNIFSFVCNR